MPRVCTICGHARRDAIDRALLADTDPLRSIADRYKVSKTSLIRHRNDHIPEKMARAHNASAVASAGSLLDQVTMLRDRSVSLLDRAEDAGDLRTALAGIREARACIELLAEVEGKLDRRNVVKIELSADWFQIRAVLLDSLAPYADARQAVAGALVAIEGGKRDVG